MPSFTLNSDAQIRGPQLAYNSDAFVGHTINYNSDATIISGRVIQITSDAYITGSAPPGPGNTQPLPNLCDVKSLCIEPANPIQNLSSEAPDLPIYIGNMQGNNPGSFPPALGGNFSSTGCLVQCVSTVSQAEADMCAQMQTMLCNVSQNPGGGGYRDQNGNQTKLYFNNAVTCAGEKCPDGLPFTYTVRAGLIAAFTQADADRMAGSLACYYARTRKVCLSNLSVPNTCNGSVYSGTITASGGSVDRYFAGNFWQIENGVIPPGLSFPTGFGPSVISITGSPTESGSWTFTVRMTTPAGDYMQKQFTICVIGVSFAGSAAPDATTLPAGTQNVPYSQTLVASGCAAGPLNWQLSSGALPDGLTINQSTGAITGTPTKAGVFQFTITLQTQAS